MLIGLTLTAAALVAPPAAAQQTLLDQLVLETVQTADGERYYQTFVPTTPPPPEGFPLVVCFHGSVGSGTGAATEYGVLEEAAARGYLAVFPEGTGSPLAGPPLYALQFWNADGCCGPPTASGVDDVGFFEAMVNELDSDHTVDTSRVFATGKSNGAMMAYRIAAERPDLLTAIAPVAGALTTAPPIAPVPLLAIHGLLDPVVPFDGWSATSSGALEVQSQVDSVLPFLGLNWSGAPVITASTDTYLFFAWPASATGAPTWYFLALDGGHTWPGQDPALAPLGQPVHADIAATPLMFDFFETL